MPYLILVVVFCLLFFFGRQAAQHIPSDTLWILTVLFLFFVAFLATLAFRP